MKQRDIQQDAGATAKRRNVKRPEATEVVDAQERTKRNFLTPAEMELLLRATKAGRYSLRDYAMLLVAYRHGFRVSELVSLARRDVSLAEARIWCGRKKNGLSTSHPFKVRSCAPS
ncbi:MAG: hypothetical protein CVU19_01885 [Betaproteobacteria bacterium HGW-Betaproteobacteria-13]|jgi:integrase|nr:MAG: hypothetical protein CVU19_01885 [Betaproteobacteria bacterium HGW-Betaproteobacteria-13]